MGNLQASEIAEITDQGVLPLAVALEWHLQSNHYPAISSVWVPVAIQAIDAANEEDWDRELARPEGYGDASITVGEVVGGLHLDSFIDWLD